MNSRTAQGDVGSAAELLLEAVPRLTRMISVEAQGDIQEESLSIPQGRVLRLIDKGLRQPSEVARHMQISPAAASELVDGLVRRGLLNRDEMEGDRRCKLLTVTGEGRRYRKISQSRALAGLNKVLNQLDSQEVESLCTGLMALMDHLPMNRDPKESSCEQE